MYVDEKVDLIDKKSDEKPEDNVNYKIWVIQVTIWVIIVALSKIIVFFFEVTHHRPIVQFGDTLLKPLQGSPELELLVVMVLIPVTVNSVQFWIQDSFLKGDKHIDTRIAK